MPPGESSSHTFLQGNPSGLPYQRKWREEYSFSYLYFTLRGTKGKCVELPTIQDSVSTKTYRTLYYKKS